MTLLTGTLAVLLPLISFFCLKKVRRLPRQKTVVSLPPLLLWIGLGGAGLIEILLLFIPGSPGLVLTCFLLALLCMSLMLACANCRIVYDAEGFDYTTFFGRTLRISYDQVLSIQACSGGDQRLKTQVHPVFIDQLMRNQALFLAQVRKAYRTAHGGLPLPVIQRKNADLYRGKIKNNGELLTAFLIVSIGICAIDTIALVDVALDRPVPPEALTVVTAPIETMYREDGWLKLVPRGGEPVLLVDPEICGDFEALEQLCRSGAPVELGYETETKDNSVKRLLHFRTPAGQLLLTPELIHAHRLDLSVQGILILLLPPLCWWFYCGLTLWIGRNAQLFRKKTLKLFFPADSILVCAPEKKKKR